MGMHSSSQTMAKSVKKASQCDICKENEFKYTCPACFYKYCSLQCFRKHKESDDLSICSIEQKRREAEKESAAMEVAHLNSLTRADNSQSRKRARQGSDEDEDNVDELTKQVLDETTLHRL